MAEAATTNVYMNSGRNFNMQFNKMSTPDRHSQFQQYRDMSISSRQAILALTVTVFLNFLQVKCRGSDKSPFGSHPVFMIIALTSLLVYYLCYDFMLRISVTPHSPGSLTFSTALRILPSFVIGSAVIHSFPFCFPIFLCNICFVFAVSSTPIYSENTLESTQSKFLSSAAPAIRRGNSERLLSVLISVMSETDRKPSRCTASSLADKITEIQVPQKQQKC